MSGFVHLNVHSCFSMLDGACSVEAMVAGAATMGMEVLALTDTDGLYGAVPFSRACKAHGIRPIYGVELSEPYRRQQLSDTRFFDGRTLRRATLLARNAAGYREICRIVSNRHLRGNFQWEDAVAALPDTVVVLTADVPLLRRRADGERDIRDVTRVEVRSFGGAGDRRERNRMLEQASALKIRAVPTNAVRFVAPGDQPVHRLLSALRMNTTVGTVPQHAVYPAGACLASSAEMTSRYRHAPAAVAETGVVADLCRFDLDLESRKLPRFPVPGGGDPYRYLRGLALRGLSERYPPASVSEARKVLDRELNVIGSLHLADYFLICHDIIRHARSRSIPCLGRGSAANSIVSYCLYITHVDPIAHNLFFERFLNEERTSLPDFDLDFGTEDREHVLDYIFDFYGRDRVAMIGTHMTFQVRSAFREISVAMGLPKGEVDGFIKKLPHMSDAENLPEKLAGSPETRDLPLDREPFATLHRYARRISGFPRHMATHPCGLVITPEPLFNFMPLQLGDKGFAVTQWTMYPVEDAGLLKIDILGQKGLEVISYTVKAVRKQGIPVPDDPRTFLTDSKTREWLREGRSVGCFYIESPAMINLIRQARCDDFECLTALSSIIRPGVSNYGGKHTYLKRHLKIEPEILLHPLLKPILHDTRGCLIYQEQVIRIASELAGLTLGQADDLRRLMSFKKNRKKLSDYRERFYRGCREKGLPEDIIHEIYRQVASFAGYAFCKAHSGSFALESFESIYYKSHHPAEFMAAVLSGGGGYYGSLEYLEESRRLGLAIHPPCINGSDVRFTGEAGQLRVGLMQVKGLSGETAEQIMDCRRDDGPYRDLPDFLERTAPSVEEARNLTRCGALRSLGRTIPELLWGIEIYYAGNVPEPEARRKHLETLWPRVPPFPDPPLPQRMEWELEILGLTPSAHPFRMFPAEIAKARRLRPVIRSVDLATRTGRDTYVLGWRVIGKKTRTRKSGDLMIFVTFSDEWGRLEATFFPRSFERNAKELLRGKGPFLLKGTVDVEFGVPMLTAERVQLLAPKQPVIRNTYGPIKQPGTDKKRRRGLYADIPVP